MAGSDRCHQHAGLEPTDAEAEASKKNPVEHGYFCTSFMNEEEKELYRAIVRGELSPAEIQRQVMGTLVVRAIRMMSWEADGKEISGLTTGAFAELRKAINALDPEALEIEHSWSLEDVRRKVESVLDEKPEHLARMVPPEKHDRVREALH